MIKPLNIDYNPSRLGQNNEQLSSNLESNPPIYIQFLLIKTFMTYVLKFLTLRLRLQPNVRNMPTVQHWISRLKRGINLQLPEPIWTDCPCRCPNSRAHPQSLQTAELSRQWLWRLLPWIRKPFQHLIKNNKPASKGGQIYVTPRRSSPVICCLMAGASKLYLPPKYKTTTWRIDVQVPRHT